MPPSSASSSARGGRGIARGGPPKRGRGTPIALGDNSLSADAPQIGGHVVTVCASLYLPCYLCQIHL